MTSNNKLLVEEGADMKYPLTIEELEMLRHQPRDNILPRTIKTAFQQLADTMRENARLREALQFFLLATDSWKTDDAFHDARINARKVLSNKESE